MLFWMLKQTEINHPEIIFLFPYPDEKERFEFTIGLHLGTSYIIAYLKTKGIAATQFIHKGPINLSLLTDKILNQKFQ